MGSSHHFKFTNDFLVSIASLLVMASSSAHAGQLLVQPDHLELRGADRQHGVLVTFVSDDGVPKDVTRTAQISVANEAIAKLNGKANCQALAEGQTELIIQAEGLTTKVPVKVAGLIPTIPSFKQDVEPILTKSGCNMGGCHGKLAGQNGFKLSLRGYAPEWDHDWLTGEVNGRRVDLAFPELSLLVQKPCGDLPHEGGVRFKPDSRMWQCLVDWIAARAPAPVADEADATELEVLPGNRQMQPDETQQLLVRAKYADGRIRDVTWLAQFFANDETTVTVKPSGLAKALRPGAASVRVHFQGLVQVISFTIPFPNVVSPDRYTAAQSAIDPPLFKKLQALHLPPAEVCSDATFLRRVFLDVIGVLPTAEEARNFLADASPTKRKDVLEKLLQRPEYVDSWALQLADLMQNRKERDHDVRGAKGVRLFHQWLRGEVAANRPWNELAKEVLLASGDVQKNPQVGYFVTLIGEKTKVEESELPDSVAQSFLGTRIGCARCHNHPLERYTQDDFYHFAAGFAKVSLDRKSPEAGSTALETITREEKEQLKKITEQQTKRDAAQDGVTALGEEFGGEDARRNLKERQREVDGSNKRLLELHSRKPGVNQPRTNKLMESQPLDRVALKFDSNDDARKPFVEWMLTTDQFSGAMVNRVWKHFMGSGLVEPVDDLRASNPPSNAELWALLNHELSSHGFDLKYLIRLIVSSRAYQLESATLPENQTETRFYSHFYARRLPAEVLLDCMAQATDVPDSFPGYPVGLRAQQLPEPGVNSYFLSLFGRSERVTACACERGGEVTLPQMLHIRNSEDLDSKIHQAQGRLTALLKNPDNNVVIDELFLNSVSRLPNEKEKSRILDALSKEPREAVFPDLFWALLNSKEFAFNH